MASTSGNIFSETLQEITNTKLKELSKSRGDFEKKKAHVLSLLDNEHDDPIKRLVILSDGVKHCLGVKTDKASGKVMRGQTKDPGLEIELKNLDSLLTQAQYDPSVSRKSLETWESSLLHHLDTQSLKYQYASLYAELVTEWLSSGKAKRAPDTSEDVDKPEKSLGASSNDKRTDALLEWERTAFEPAQVDETKLKEFLAELFSDNDNTKTKRNALNTFKESVTKFEDQLSSQPQFTQSTLHWTIRGLLSSDLLSDEKREVLKSFQSSPVILSEIVDVLNMRIAALDNWTWGTSVAVEQVRSISGAYNIHMHEDLLQALFLQYIGVKWSVFFKGALMRIRKFGGPWKSLRADVPKTDKKSIHRQDYFLSHLLDTESQQIEMADGEEEAEEEEVEQQEFMERSAAMSMKLRSAEKSLVSAQGTGRGKGLGRGGAMRHRKIVPERDPEDTETDDDYATPKAIKKPMDAKHKLLHILSTEIAINTRVHGEITALRTSFDSWNSLLPHATIRTVLKFFGVSPQWLDFFQQFLEAPLKFTNQDETAAPRIRRRGTPPSHVLSTVFGEAVLFCLDFSVNQVTNGALLYRLYDDLWFWGPDHQASVKTWSTIESFASITGTKLNLSKTGSVRISGNPDVTLSLDKSLPEGQIGWGFLQLSPNTGRFEINQPMVDKHIEELRRQLQGKRSSVFAFIQTWNTYASTFFTSNFGKPANCFGRKHVDLMLSTHSRIQSEIFKAGSALNTTGDVKTASVVDYLKEILSQRFHVGNIPDAYFFFPVELGGLDLQSPFISILQIRDSIIKDPVTLLDKFQENERDWYNRAKIAFEKGEITPSERSDLDDPDWEPIEKQDRETFLSFEEFTRWREEFSLGFEYELATVYEKLLDQPDQETLELDTERIASGISALGKQGTLRGILANWHIMEPYWKWVVMQYGPEVMERFGGLNIVDAGLLPMGMVSLFRDKRVKWQG